MSPIDIKTARSRFIRALVAALAVAAVVAGSAFALTKHPSGAKAEPWIADSAKQRAALDQALAGLEQQKPAATRAYKALKIKKWHRPKPRVVVTAPRVVVVNKPTKTVQEPSGSSTASQEQQHEQEQEVEHEDEHEDDGGDD